MQCHSVDSVESMEFESEYEKIKEILESIFSKSRHQQLRILVIGNIGSGKSSLINTLLNEPVAKVKSGLGAVTHEVNPFKGLAIFRSEVNGIRVTLWDSPGFQEPYMTLSEKSDLLKEIKTECRDVDLVVYCIKMTNTRLRKEEMETISDLTQAFSCKIWDRSLFALTFANNLDVPANDAGSCTKYKYFKTNCGEWKMNLHHILAAVGYGKEVPVIPVGRDIHCHLSSGNWFVNFWIKCCERSTLSGFTKLVDMRGIEVKSLDSSISIAEAFMKKLPGSTECSRRAALHMFLESVKDEESSIIIKILWEDLNVAIK